MEEFKRKLLEKGQEKVFIKKYELKEIDSTDYVAEVNNAGEDVCVLLNFYQTYNEFTLHLNNLFA